MNIGVGVGLYTGVMLCTVLWCLHSGDMSESIVGWVALFSAITVWGSHIVLIKHPSVGHVHAIEFQVYISIGSALTGAFIAGVTAAVSPTVFQYPWLGSIGAAMWVLCMLAAYNAINGLGVAIAPAGWSGITVLVAFILGSVLFHETIDNHLGAILSLLGVLLGIACVAICRNVDKLLGAPSVNVPLIPQADMTRSRTTSILCVLLMGIVNGSLMVPSTLFFQDNPEGVYSYILAFTSSSVGISVLVWLVWSNLSQESETTKSHISVALVPGVLTGFFWCSGFFSAVIATQKLGQALGYSLTQLALCINALWGILYYKEIRGSSSILVFSIGVAIILGSATGLTLAKGI